MSDATSNVVTVTQFNIAEILTKRFGEGDSGSGLTLSCHEAHMLMARLHEKATTEEIAVFVEHLRDDYLCTTEPVKKVARLIREKFGTGNQPTQEQALELGAQRHQTDSQTDDQAALRVGRGAEPEHQCICGHSAASHLFQGEEDNCRECECTAFDDTPGRAEPEKNEQDQSRSGQSGNLERLTNAATTGAVSDSAEVLFRRALEAVLKCETYHDERGHAFLAVPARSLSDLGAAIKFALDTHPKSDMAGTELRPAFLIAAEVRAKELGVSVETVLQADSTEPRPNKVKQ